MGPFHGLTILDLTRLLPGAVATAYFAARGAEVIKIEQPKTGDYGRTLQPALFARTNTGKKSLTLDLKHPRGKEVLLRLADEADVLIEGFRPGVMERLGLAYSEASRRNPRLIYVSLTGYGQTGPLSGLSGHDINYIAMGGLLGLNLPVIPGTQIADLAGGAMQSIIGILTALVERSGAGRGQYVDVSMTAGVTSLLEIPLANYFETGREPVTGSEMLSGRYACYNVYGTADGRAVAVGALESKFWAELCRRLGLEDAIPAQYDDARQDEIKSRLAAIFQTRAAQEWFELLRSSDCCVAPVLTVGEVARGLAARAGAPAPELGEHTFSTLIAAGFTEEEIEDLNESGALG